RVRCGRVARAARLVGDDEHRGLPPRPCTHRDEGARSFRAVRRYLAAAFRAGRGAMKHIAEKQVAITGIGQSEIARPSRKSPLRLTVDAALAAIHDAGL